MHIYLIRHDIDNFKFYLQDDGDPYSVRAFDFCGESLSDEWKPYKVELFEGKTKAEKSLNSDFNSSCFNSGLLYVERYLAKEISCKVANIECLEIVTSDERDFHYINVLDKIPALDYANKQELQIMYRTDGYKFNRSVESMVIFRDKVLSSNYFVTDRFVDLFPDKFHGVIFKKVGEI